MVVPGDRLEVRGPIGGYFVWDVALGGPLLLVAGGSGIVPLMAMLRHRARAGSRVPTCSAVQLAARGGDHLSRRARPAGRRATTACEVVHTLTRSHPPDWTGYTRRIDEHMLAGALGPLGLAARAYICGPTSMVETAASALVGLGLPADRIRTERFGPTGT